MRGDRCHSQHRQAQPDLLDWSPTTQARSFWQTGEIEIANDLSEAEATEMLIFEMHNLGAKDQFAELVRQAQNNTIKKEDYVRRNREIEYNNALSTNEAVKELKKKGLLDPNFKSETAKDAEIQNFDEWLGRTRESYLDAIRRQYDFYRKQGPKENP